MSIGEVRAELRDILAELRIEQEMVSACHRYLTTFDMHVWDAWNGIDRTSEIRTALTSARHARDMTWRGFEVIDHAIRQIDAYEGTL